jgi:virulence factor Mce-like protein
MLMKAQQRTAVTQGVVLRTYGVVFLVVLGLLIGLTVAIYNKTFVDVVTVTLETNRVGNQLAPPADVKLRGMIVGEVREVRSDGERASIEIALQPDKATMIPADVRARLLPKTLFGEKFVDLVAPGRVSGPRIAEGDVIPQDRSATAIELETVLDNILPLLRTIKPAKLNATLNAFATALEGRGERLGENLELVDGYFTQLNPQLETIKTDITGLADVSEIYADAAPDLVRMLRNFSVSSRTIAERSEAYAGFLAGTAGFARTTRDFLAENESRIIQVNSVGRPTLELLARYSPEYPCLLEGLTQSNDFIGDAFANGELHITLEVVQARRQYEPGEEPRWGENRGPSCYGLPNPPEPWPGNRFADGTRGAGSARAVPGFDAAPVDPTSGHSGTAAEQGVVDALVAPSMGVRAAEVPDLATLLFGPMARGTAVRQS